MRTLFFSLKRGRVGLNGMKPNVQTLLRAPTIAKDVGLGSPTLMCIKSPRLGATSDPASSRLAELLTEAVQGFLLAADAEERTLFVGTLLQHLAVREDFAAQLLRRPR